MIKKFLYLLFFSMSLAGCHSNAETDESSDPHSVKDEIEMENGGQKVEAAERKLKVNIEGKTYPFLYKDYPILAHYVNNDPKPEETLNELPFAKVKEDVFLVEFACHESKCSHLLLDFDKKNSFLLSDLSAVTFTKVTPDHQYAAFLFERSQEAGRNHQLVVMNLNTLEPVELEAADENLLPKPNQYQYEIRSVNFISEAQIEITCGTLSDPENTASMTSRWLYR